MGKINVGCKCRLCGGITRLEGLDEEKVMLYESGTCNIMEVFPELKSHEREALISGTCYKCQESLYNIPLVSDPATFGKFLGTCPVCDCRVYEKESAGDDTYRCKSCNSLLELNDGELTEIDDEEFLSDMEE